MQGMASLASLGGDGRGGAASRTSGSATRSSEGGRSLGCWSMRCCCAWTLLPFMLCTNLNLAALHDPGGSIWLQKVSSLIGSPHGSLHLGQRYTSTDAFAVAGGDPLTATTTAADGTAAANQLQKEGTSTADSGWLLSPALPAAAATAVAAAPPPAAVAPPPRPESPPSQPLPPPYSSSTAASVTEAASAPAAPPAAAAAAVAAAPAVVGSPTSFEPPQPRTKPNDLNTGDMWWETTHNRYPKCRESAEYLQQVNREPIGTLPEVAVCLLGGFRNFHSKEVRKTLRAAFRNLQPYEVFLILRDAKVDLEEEKAACPIQPVVYIEDSPGSPARISCRPQENLLRRAYKAVRDREEARGRAFSWIIKARPDLLILKAFPPLPVLAAMAARDSNSNSSNSVSAQEDAPHASAATATAAAEAAAAAPLSGDADGVIRKTSILIPAFMETTFDPATCRIFDGKSKAAFDEDWRPCTGNDTKMSRHLLADQLAVVPRSLAPAYFNRHTPSWTHPMPHNRPKQPPPEGGDHIEFWATCKLTEGNYRLGGGSDDTFLGGCECGLSVYTRHICNTSVTIIPMIFGLLRKDGIQHRGAIPSPLLRWVYNSPDE